MAKGGGGVLRCHDLITLNAETNFLRHSVSRLRNGGVNWAVPRDVASRLAEGICFARRRPCTVGVSLVYDERRDL